MLYGHYLSDMHRQWPEVTYGSYVSECQSHSNPHTYLLGETERTRRFQANIDFVASYVFAIYQRLPTRESMKAFSGYRKARGR
jgi:hypothetical protein